MPKNKKRNFNSSTRQRTTPHNASDRSIKSARPPTDFVNSFTACMTGLLICLLPTSLVVTYGHADRLYNQPESLIYWHRRWFGRSYKYFSLQCCLKGKPHTPGMFRWLCPNQHAHRLLLYHLISSLNCWLDNIMELTEADQALAHTAYFQ